MPASSDAEAGTPTNASDGERDGGGSETANAQGGETKEK